MALVSNPSTISDVYQIKPERLKKLGVLDATLALDTALFIDPLLLGKSVHPEMKAAAKSFDEHFRQIIKLLSVSKVHNDVAWRSARSRMKYPEVSATCLGYGAASIEGRGWGPRLTKAVMTTAKEIVDLGINDPSLFCLLALFEKGIGADRMSDMTTTIIMPQLIEFNQRVISGLKLEPEEHAVGKHTALLLGNPFARNNSGLLLVPSDVLKKLPVGVDRSDICYAVDHNAELRDRVNQHVSELWYASNKENREKLKRQALKSSASFKTLIDAYRAVQPIHYDIGNDPDGFLRWTTEAKDLTESHRPLLTLTDRKKAHVTVEQIIKEFQFLVENRGLWKSMYFGDKPVKEDYVQRLFFATAYSWCKANNLDISPEVDTGSGQIDFKFSTGFKDKVIVEIKLSTGRVLSGYEKQIARYNAVEEAQGGFYIIIDVGGMKQKDEEVMKLRASYIGTDTRVTKVNIVDATRKLSASKL